jgi:uncharacterized membrane protein YjfL (UPF0719 family)
MAPTHKEKDRVYLFAIIKKAWAELGFIEAISEAIGGFVIGIVLFFTRAMDTRDAFVDIAECVGCAIIVPIIAFTLRTIFTAPAELVKESIESKRKYEINPASVYPSVIAILLVICSILSIGLFLSLKFNISRIGATNAPQIAKQEPPKPLPDKIIPAITTTNQNLPFPAIFPNAQATAQSETNNPSTENAGNAYDEAKADHAAQIKAQDDECQKENQAVWEHNYQLFNHAIESLHNILNNESGNHGDGIAKTEGYFQCLPKNILFGMPETNIAEIRFQWNTNIDFQVATTHSVNVGPTIIPTGLKISCSSSWIELRPFWPMSGLHIKRIIHTPDYDEEKDLPDDTQQKLVDEGLRIIVAAQIDHESHTALLKQFTK